MSGGAKAKIIECLEGRTSKRVNASETAGVTEMAPEAFKGCDNLNEIDLTQSALVTIPESAFEDTTSLNTVKLPITCEQIDDYAFRGSNITWLEESGNKLQLISLKAFENALHSKDDNKNHKEITLCGPQDSYLY